MLAHSLNPIQPRTQGLDKLKTLENTWPKAIYCHQKGVLLPCYQPIKHMNFNSFTRVTICLSSSRSYSSLSRAVRTINENIYGEEAYANERIEFKDLYNADGSLDHFELTGTPLDLFQVGLRYGGYEEAKREKLAI